MGVMIFLFVRGDVGVLGAGYLADSLIDGGWQDDAFSGDCGTFRCR
jgi:hypothetical protein